ncbi:MAG: methylenetetrahydrofolate reductase, partial [Clostridia bacterium]|nr:methylenetetrahydrofolate reductase [Clostridia bacterium]
LRRGRLERAQRGGNFGASERGWNRALAHLTGGPSSPEEIDGVAGELKALGVENVLALRGDKPQDFSKDYCKYFPHATDLMKHLQKYGFATGAACYPEGHVESGSLYEDLKNLKKKEECGASFFISQIFYDNSYYYRLVNEARKLGITSPIIPGIMPLVNANNLKRIQAMCGSTVPIELRNMIEVYGQNPVVMREVGINYAVYQITDLIAKGAPGVHLYIMNRAETANEIYARLENCFHELF